ncbi:MAG TPA: hypothetical protein VHG08_28540 [Longimicrobium sp.]|nr:hypothetical protein [Longimicrobium sp.]
MTDPSDPPVRAPRSPARLLRSTAGLAILFPLLKWVQSLSFPDPGRVQPGPVWVSFATVLAVAGACVGAGVYAARPHRWLQSYLIGVMIVLMVNADIQQFAGMPLHTWLLQWVPSSLGMGIVAGAIYHVIVWW